MAKEAAYLTAEMPHRATSSRTFQQVGELDALIEWLDEADQQGLYYLREINHMQTIVWFSDPDTAFAFRMRWG